MKGRGKYSQLEMERGVEMAGVLHSRLCCHLSRWNDIFFVSISLLASCLSY